MSISDSVAKQQLSLDEIIKCFNHEAQMAIK